MLLAQISDLHVVPKGELAYGKVDTAAMLRDAIEHLKRLPLKVDAVLVTGDLAHNGAPEAYEHLREVLAQLNCPVLVIPGNHDDIGHFRRAFADHAYLPHDGQFIQFVVDDYAVRIVAIDSVVPGRVRGMLCAERLAWLDHTLAERPHTPTLVMMHHAPFATGLQHVDLCGMDGIDGLEFVISRHPQVERLVCGHVHRAIQTRFGGSVASTCPSTAHQVQVDLRPDGQDAFTLEPAGFQLHRWNGRVLFTYTLNVGIFDGPFPFR
ncbi:MAG TPA: phosphodiesterase [Burkholderiales bacterium]|nr:phosphodiesterase [Burkholderiales bacterium]